MNEDRPQARPLNALSIAFLALNIFATFAALTSLLPSLSALVQATPSGGAYLLENLFIATKLFLDGAISISTNGRTAAVSDEFAFQVMLAILSSALGTMFWLLLRMWRRSRRE